VGVKCLRDSNDNGKFVEGYAMISIITPCLNEADNLAARFGEFARQEQAQNQGKDWEWIVVDGGSDDRSARIAEELGARLIHAPRGRGTQLNAGARRARGDVLGPALPGKARLLGGAVAVDTRPLSSGRIRRKARCAVSGARRVGIHANQGARSLGGAPPQGQYALADKESRDGGGCPGELREVKAAAHRPTHQPAHRSFLRIAANARAASGTLSARMPKVAAAPVTQVGRISIVQLPYEFARFVAAYGFAQ
jgi:hypothetical protein